MNRISTPGFSLLRASRRWIVTWGTLLLLASAASGADEPKRLDPRIKEPVLTRADLVPWSMTFALCAPTVECRNCPPVSIHIGVHNQGKSAANGTIIIQLFGAMKPSQPIYTRTVNSVPAGGTVVIGFFTHPRECPGDPPGPAGFSYRIVVDAKNAIAESNEQNNTAIWTLKGNFSPK